MRKRLTAILVCSLFLISAFALGITFVNKSSAYAADGDPELPGRGDALTADVLGNNELFKALLKIVNAQRPYPMPQTDNFLVEYFENYEVLDLSGTGKESAEKIKTLDGLELLILGGLKVLILDDNLIAEITDLQMAKVPNLKTLSIKNNKLARIDFALNDISYLNLYNNDLTSITLPGAVAAGTGVVVVNDYAGNPYNSGYTAGRAYCNLELNRFSNINNIDLTETIPLDIFLTGNRLVNATPADFAGHNVSLLLQGYSKEGNYTQGDLMRLTSNELYTDFNIKITYQAGNGLDPENAGYKAPSDYYDENNPDKDAAVAQSGLISLPAGRVVISFYNGITLITEGIYETKEVSIKPKKPIFKMFDKDGKVINNARNEHGGQFTVKVVSATPDVVPFVKFQEDTKYKHGDTIEIYTMGTYFLAAQVRYDGVYSDTAYETVRCTASESLGWALILIVGAAVLGIAIWYGIRWYRQGAIVAPLSEEEISRMERRRGR